MRNLALAVLLTAVLVAPAAADESEPQGQMVVLKARDIGQIFCLSRTGNDEAVIAGILTADLGEAIATAERKDADYAKQYPEDKPPLGDGVPWQSSPDYADSCAVGLVTLSRSDARVELKYAFKDAADASYTDTLILKKVPVEGTDVGHWRIDDVIYPDGTDLKSTLLSLFSLD